MRNTGAILAALLALPACGVGDEDDVGGGSGTPSTPDDRICDAALSITGSFAMSQPAPDVKNNDTDAPGADGKPDFTGCWPTGTWTFTAKVETSTCDVAPAPAAEYKFVTTYAAGSDGAGPQYAYQLMAPALSDNYRLKVSSGGGGLCEGVMELYLDGGKKAWYLHPALNDFNKSGPLTGIGDYNEYAESIYP